MSPKSLRSTSGQSQGKPIWNINQNFDPIKYVYERDESKLRKRHQNYDETLSKPCCCWRLPEGRQKIHLITSLNKLWINKATRFHSIEHAWMEPPSSSNGKRRRDKQAKHVPWISAGYDLGLGGSSSALKLVEGHAQAPAPVSTASRVSEEKIYRILLWLDGMDLAGAQHIRPHQKQAQLSRARACHHSQKVVYSLSCGKQT